MVKVTSICRGESRKRRSPASKISTERWIERGRLERAINDRPYKYDGDFTAKLLFRSVAKILFGREFRVAVPKFSRQYLSVYSLNFPIQGDVAVKRKTVAETFNEKAILGRTCLVRTCLPRVAYYFSR